MCPRSNVNDVPLSGLELRSFGHEAYSQPVAIPNVKYRLKVNKLWELVDGNAVEKPIEYLTNTKVQTYCYTTRFDTALWHYSDTLYVCQELVLLQLTCNMLPVSIYGQRKHLPCQ